MDTLEGKIAIVTGAAQGLGAEYALALANKGVRVIAVDAKSSEKTVAAVRLAGGEAINKQVDIRDACALREMVEATIQTWGSIDILINNAAVAADLDMKPFLEIDSADWDHVMAVNARGTFECIKAVAVPMIRQRRGKIVNIASTTFFKGAARMMHYVASKGAVIGITRVAARELGEFGITVNCIAPGLTMTDTLREKSVFGKSAQDANIDSRAIRREQVGADLTGAMLFFASSQSDFTTGQTLIVDGGNHMI